MQLRLEAQEVEYTTPLCALLHRALLGRPRRCHLLPHDLLAQRPDLVCSSKRICPIASTPSIVFLPTPTGARCHFTARIPTPDATCLSRYCTSMSMTSGCASHAVTVRRCVLCSKFSWVFLCTNGPRGTGGAASGGARAARAARPARPRRALRSARRSRACAGGTSGSAASRRGSCGFLGGGAAGARSARARRSRRRRAR